MSRLEAMAVGKTWFARLYSYSRLKNRELWVALDSHQGFFNFLHPRYPHRGVGTDLNTLAWLAEGVPSC